MAGNAGQEPEFTLDFGGAIPQQLTRWWKWLFVIVGLALAVVLLSILRGIYTDLLWYDQMGFRGVYVKVLVTRVVLFFLGSVLFGALLGVSLFFAGRFSQGPLEAPLPQATQDLLRKLIKWGTLVAAIVLSVIFGVILAGEWEIFLRFGNSVPFGLSDPVYNKDISFYVFDLPVYDFLKGWALGASIVILLATLGLYFVNFSFRGVGFAITTGVKVQVSLVAALVMLTVGAGHWLDRWALVLSDHRVVHGANYADINALKPALLILTIVAVASSVLILVNAYMRGIRLLVGGVALWLVMAVLLQGGWPNAMQRFTVNPNEFVKEAPYIERNIEFTRSGFGLADITDTPYPADPSLTADIINANLQTVDNIRLWDHSPISSVYRQIQQIRPYYTFMDADVDRYEVGGRYRQVMLAAREVAPEKLDPESQTWVNLKLRYTHGFGLTMSPVTEFTSEGRPVFFAKDIPADGILRVKATSPDSEPELEVTNPRIYYGENTSSWVIVNTDTPELDYQGQGGELKSHNYAGTGGVSVGSFLNRLAYAWELRDINVLITGRINSDSRVQYRREIQTRISTIAPFLLLDEDPYIVAADEGLFWIQDAFTVSDRYPYSEPNEEGFNYIRNSVKVTVDAYNGTVRFHIWDPDDPMVRTYQKIFPDLFEPMEAMPDSLERHVRYPRDLFSFQAEKYLKYHMTVPVNFYNLEDLWGIPDEKFGQGGELQEVRPYYVIMKIPGEEREEFVLLIPYTRNVPPIMAGWLAARSDGDNYGKLVGFNFPKDRQVDSPIQIEAKIDNDAVITKELTLLCQIGSECIRGNLLVLPMIYGDAFGLLYAEPIYLQAEGVEFPELKRVILATQEKVVMEDSIPKALASLTGFSAPVAGAPEEKAEAPPAEASTPVDPVRAGVQRLTEALEELKKGLAEFEEALESLSDQVGD